MTNPYSVLGISENADNEQIKEAYRVLAREYHAQLNNGSPESDIAAVKMAELDEAYDAIMAQRSGSYGSSAQYGGNSAYGSYRDSSQFGDVRAHIDSGRINDAEVILDGIPKDMRNAEWYYLKGRIQHQRGWFDEAYNNYSKACQLDPSNAEYSSAFNNLNQKHNGGYRQSSTSSSICTSCDICTGLMCADCCCNCLGDGCC